MISLEREKICPDELDKLDKMRKFGWDESSENIIEDNKVYINFPSAPSVCLL